MMSLRVCTLFLLAGTVALAAQVGSDPHTALLETKGSDNPMQKVPVVGSQFEVEPVATSINCVVSLTIQYFIIYTALALVRTIADFWALDYNGVPLQKVLHSATDTVSYAPMLSILFLATRMRVTWLTAGKGNPPEWVQMWMYCCTYAVLAMTLIVMVLPLFTGEIIGVDPKTGDFKEDDEPFQNWILAGLFTVLKFLIMIGLYVGAVAIIYGTWNYVPEKEFAVHDELPPVSPAVACTMNLSTQFFLVYACLSFARTQAQFTKAKFSAFEEAMLIAAQTMMFAPMLSVLFIGARMRALQMDPVNGAPQKWAQNCFYMCTYAVLAQTLISIAVTLVLKGTAEKGDTEGDMKYTVTAYPALGAILTAARYVIMFCIYVGFSCVIYSVFTIQHPKGDEYTPPISVTMQCVINLTFQFFFIYLVIWVCTSIKEWSPNNAFPLITNTMENLKGTVAYCPMLAILFVATRMRALRITDNKGAPQGWAQDGMYMATWAVLVQFLFGLLVPLCTGTATPCDEDGTPAYKPTHQWAVYAVSALKWFTFIFLYAGTIAVVVGVYTMTPETANGRGAVPLAGDGKVPGVDVQVPGYDGVGEPAGVNDIPTAVQ